MARKRVKQIIKRKYLTGKFKLKIAIKFNFTCYWCRKKFENIINPYGFLWCYPSGKKEFHIDHVIPLSKGGKDIEENMVFACKTCNLSKGNREWRKKEC